MSGHVTRRTHEIRPDELPGRAGLLLAEGFRLALVSARDERPERDELRVVYLFVAGPPDRRVELHVPVDGTAPAVPTLAGISFPASRFEREVRDLYGVVPLDHPLPRRLVRHQHWPRGWYPGRRDAGPPPPFDDPDEPYPFLTVEGPGVYEIPVGPVHAGLIEPGHFRFSVVGETVLKLKARLWFVHKGIEKLAEGRKTVDALPLAERVSGDTTAGHTLAYCLAIEEAFGIEVPEPARVLRAVALELERLYNHVADIGALANDVGYGIVQAHALRIREALLRINDDVCGHRLLRGMVVPGGARAARLPSRDQLAAVDADVREVVDLALGHTVVRERFTGTAVLTGEQARDIGVLGYVARASGVDIDARRMHPFLDLGDGLHPAVQSGGDVLARFLVRATEFHHSVGLLRQLLGRVEAGSYVADQPSRPAASGIGEPGGGGRSGVGLVEGWRGTIAHRVEVDAEGVLRRWKVVDPSFFNWPALPVTLTDTIVPDFPLVNKSFNQSYAGNDL